MPTTVSATPPARPVPRYLGGVHHIAQPTMDPAATLEFYVDTMGAKITHCISSRGWRESHYDYIHMFLDLGKGDNIAMFYYFGAEDPKDWPKYGTHHSFAANTKEELDQWADFLESKGHKIVWRAQYEVFSSLYVWDPNGRFLEIAWNHRQLNEIDADDAELTAQALIRASRERATSITTMWAYKAELVEEREGAVPGPAVFLAAVPEFLPFIDAVHSGLGEQRQLGNFVALVGDGELHLKRPNDMPEAVWNAVGTGGLKGEIVRYDANDLVIR